MKKCLLFIFFTLFLQNINAQQSVARRWNEIMLSGIRQDFARPPIIARNLYHTSLAMYEAWASIDPVANNYLLGNIVDSIYFPFAGLPYIAPADTLAAQEMALSYAAYRIIKQRAIYSVNPMAIINMADTFFNNLGYSSIYTYTNFLKGTPAALGNYIAKKIIELGAQDGANEVNYFSNSFYAPVNFYLNIGNPGNATMSNVARWQPLSISNALDQNGNPIPSVQQALNPEWGNVLPFSLTPANCVHYFRNSNDYTLYFDTPPPPQLSLTNAQDSSSIACKYGHSMVAIWSGLLDPADTTLIDISPNAYGNTNLVDTDFYNVQAHYNFLEGGDTGKGYALNPATGMPYTPNFVKRADFARVVSQYWADGPSSETPPGHWFVLLNEVSDNPLTQKKIGGTGPLVSNLEWDIKAYLTLGAAMHDAAIAAWSSKGWHDSPRPISIIRRMAQLGQSSDTLLPNYHAGGIPLIPGKIELVGMGDSLAGSMNQHVGKVKLWAWRGFNYIVNPATDVAGTGWILAENWMPYQRKTFVTPPFPGYVSGHSTFSRAGAKILAEFTGDAFFPGGIHKKMFPANNGFLVFEQGPSDSIELQWARYNDASNEASLSRIYGGIHPYFDDMNGRLMGEEIGTLTMAKVTDLFTSFSPLTLQVNNFTATNTNCKATISFTSSNQDNVQAYHVLKSNDGISYKILGTVQSKNDPDNKYTFIDENPMDYNYYRLVAEYQNAKQTISANTTYFNACALQNTTLSIYPNPTNGQFVVQQNATEATNISLQIMDVTGKQVFFKNYNLNYGINKIKLSLSNLPAGTYFAVSTNPEGIESKVSFQLVP